MKVPPSAMTPASPGPPRRRRWASRGGGGAGWSGSNPGRPRRCAGCRRWGCHRGGMATGSGASGADHAPKCRSRVSLSAAGSTAPATTKVDRAGTARGPARGQVCRRELGDPGLGALGGVGEGGRAVPGRQRDRRRHLVVKGLLDGPNLLVPDEVSSSGAKVGRITASARSPSPSSSRSAWASRLRVVLRPPVDTHRSSARRSVASAKALESRSPAPWRSISSARVASPGWASGSVALPPGTTTRTLTRGRPGWGTTHRRAPLASSSWVGAGGVKATAGPTAGRSARGRERAGARGASSARRQAVQGSTGASLTSSRRSVLLRSRGGPEGGPVGPRGAAPPPP